MSNIKDKKLLLVAPYITTCAKLFTTPCLHEILTKKIGLYLYIQIKYSPTSLKQREQLLAMLDAEDNVSSVSYDRKDLIVLFRVPSNHECVVKFIACSEISDITKTIVLDNLRYWKENTFLIFE